MGPAPWEGHAMITLACAFAAAYGDRSAEHFNYVAKGAHMNRKTGLLYVPKFGAYKQELCVE
jgi:hypothetical protein